MQPIDKAIAILAGTQDGARLSAQQLKLTELAANNNLSAVGLAELEQLYRSVTRGEYAPPGDSLFGIAHLTRDGAGYVYWKGRSVEHYSHTDREAMQQAAQRLANRCMHLEANGFPVTGRSVTEPIFQQAPAATPWLEAMNRFYALFEGAGRHVAIFFRDTSPGVAILERDKATGKLKQTLQDTAYDAFHFVQRQGLRSTSPYQSYEEFKGFFEASGLTPQDIQQTLAAS
jgi:hypothetical protein